MLNNFDLKYDSLSILILFFVLWRDPISNWISYNNNKLTPNIVNVCDIFNI